jgi:flagellar biosynthetic protein FliQ
LVKALMFQAVMLALPILITAMVIGLFISLFQSVTSIQEQTLAFVPKALGVTGIIVILLPWLLRTTLDFTTTIIQRLPDMAR